MTITNIGIFEPESIGYLALHNRILLSDLSDDTSFRGLKMVQWTA